MSTLPDAEPLIEQLGAALQNLLKTRGVDQPLMVGIRTGGLWVADRLATLLGLQDPVGALDIGFHRDDFDERGLPAGIRPTHINGGVDDRVVVLVDDVLHSGRTVRAAINALFEYGRPSAILLVVLADRGGRQLPIQPDLAAHTLDLPAGTRLKLSGPDPLSWALREPGA